MTQEQIDQRKEEIKKMSPYEAYYQGFLDGRRDSEEII